MNDKYREITEESGDGVVALTDDCGEVVRFYHIGTIEYKGGWYAFFKPYESLDGVDPDELLIYRIEGDDKSEDLVQRMYGLQKEIMKIKNTAVGR